MPHTRDATFTVRQDRPPRPGDEGARAGPAAVLAAAPGVWKRPEMPPPSWAPGGVVCGAEPTAHTGVDDNQSHGIYVSLLRGRLELGLGAGAFQVPRLPVSTPDSAVCGSPSGGPSDDMGHPWLSPSGAECPILARGNHALEGEAQSGWLAQFRLAAPEAETPTTSSLSEPVCCPPACKSTFSARASG